MHYQAELDAFLHLRHVEKPESSMIGFYGSYLHGSTFNIILEYANGGTLEDYFRNIPPPVDGKDIFHVWSGLLQVWKALWTVHQVIFSDLEDSRTFQGYVTS